MEEDGWGVSFLEDCEGLLDDMERDSQLTGEEEDGEELGSSLEPFNLFTVTAVEEANGRCVHVCVRVCVCACMRVCVRVCL